MMTRAVEGKLRLIPVLLADADMPPLLASRVWVDLRSADGPEYEKAVRKLVALLKGERPAPPPRTGELLPRPDTAFRAEGVISRRLRIGRDKVALLNKDVVEADHQPKGLSFRTQHQLLFDLERLRHGHLPEEAGLYRAAGSAGAASQESRQHALLLEVGAALGVELLDGAAGEALGRVLAEAERLGAPFELALEPEDDLAGLPWETLRLPGPGGLPGEPVALHPNVRLFRSVSNLGPTPALSIPGPLRILVAIGSPEEQNERGELLDMERELSRILDAVEPARRQERPAHVRVLERGTVQAIREALEGERYHVLHITCHAGPGTLVLETEEGGKDEVKADRFCDEALVPGRSVPVVVLAGCATALSSPLPIAGEGPGERAQGESALPGLARDLLARGVPAVVAMQAPVSDPYATELGARFYRTLAIAERPDPLAALVQARRSVETDRQAGKLAGPVDLAEWATPSLYLRGPSLPLFDLDVPFKEIQPPPEPRFAEGIVVRRVGEFVGRRREKRQILHTLQTSQKAGVLLRGLGGVGKSTLAAETLRKLLEEGWLVASLHGEIAPDDLLAEVGHCYLAAFQREGMNEGDPRRQLAVALGRPDLDWEQRFELLSRILLGDRPLVVLLDNFEDNLADGGLGPGLKNEDLADLLAHWMRNPGRSRFLVTSRPPFELPRDADERLKDLHLGPLSFAETRKLMWRLPGLDALDRDGQLRAYTDVGGHPRALEYLDALLRGGEARFDDVAERMESALERKGIQKPDVWLRRAKGDLDRALAEAVTLAVDDVLLDRLLEKLEGVPIAKELLLGASVYRVPIDLVGLAWQVAEEIEDTGDRLPLNVPEGLGEALALLGTLGLLVPVQWSDSADDARFAGHRWTASAVLGRSPANAVRQAHERAARHWRWRVKRVPQSRQDDIAQLLEARQHYREAGDIDGAVEVTEGICSQLDTWGAYRREEQLCREVLTWLPERSAKAAVFLHGLGIVAQKRGDYDQALEWYKRSLQIKEELGNRSGMASTYHQLGMVAKDRGDSDQALEWYKRSLQINEELGNRAGMATYGQLGRMAQDRGDSDQALEWYKRSLQISEELGNRSGMASTISQLGVLATTQGRPEEALPLNLRSLAIRLELRVPEVRIDLHWLRRQRELLGEERFAELLQEHVGEEGAQGVLDLMAGMDGGGMESAESGQETETPAAP